MEDTLRLQKGVFATSSGQLVERLAGIAQALNLEVASVEEAEAMLSLPRRAS